MGVVGVLRERLFVHPAFTSMRVVRKGLERARVETLDGV